jgi:hypothetical protein
MAYVPSRWISAGLCAGMLLTATIASAEPPPFQAEIAAWAEKSRFRLERYRNCTGVAEKYFGSLGSVCWHARRSAPLAGGRTFPRVDITLEVFPDEPAARHRMTRFRELPAGLVGEAAKTYPLRAGFRVGSRVVVVTTDALAFERHATQAAIDLAAAIGGSDLVCWKHCDPSAP